MSKKKIFALVMFLSAVVVIGLLLRDARHGNQKKSISPKMEQGKKSAQAAKQPETRKQAVGGVGTRPLSDEEYAQYYASLTPEEKREHDEIERIHTTIEGAQELLAEIKKVLSGDETANWGARFSFAILVGGWPQDRRNELVPYMRDFIRSRKLSLRVFGRDTLFDLGTEEALALLRKEFWRFYKRARNWEKIEGVSAAGSYLGEKIDLGIRGTDEYWEARSIFIDMVKHGASVADEIALQLVGAEHGLGVLAAKHLWRSRGEKYRDEFYKYSQAPVDGEIFYTFIKELRDIFWDGRQKEFEEIEKIQADFDLRAIAMVENTNLDDSILENVIMYLSQAESQWFADNWIRLYKFYTDDVHSWRRIDSAIRVGLASNENAKKNIEMLKGIINEDDYNNLINFIREQEEINKNLEQERIRKAKWEVQQQR